MSVLDNPAPVEPNAADEVAEQLIQQCRLTFQQLVNAFNTGAQLFWAHQRATPVEIATALGVSGKEIFELHGKIGALLATVKPEAIANGMAVVGEFFYNEDGTVTITSTPAPVEPNVTPA